MQNNKKVVFVTGGAMGIGRAVCERLSVGEAIVMVADKDVKAAAETAHAICAAGHEAHALEIDLADHGSISSAFSQVEERFGRCDILVNNAGIAKTYPFLEFPLDNWALTMQINVTGAMLCSQHAARMMVKRKWGRIVSIASVAGMRAVGSGRTAYGVSKAAVIGLTRQMAAELAEHGVTANAVAPGPVDTPMTKVLHSPDFRTQYTKAIPANRYGLTSEIASAVAYLASDEAGYINGTTVPVDGGFMATGARGV